MTDSKNDLHHMAAQYMDLWQKQMMSQSSERVVEDALKTSNALNEQMGEMMKGFDTPEKRQQWMTTWAETWKAQIENATGQQQTNPFWPPTAGAASGNDQHNVDELEKRIAALEERVHSLNPSLKNEVEDLLLKLDDHADDTFAAAVDVEAYLRGLAFINGVKAYHAHPYQRDVENPAPVWQQGGSRLLDYGGPDDGPVMLAVPSLINKAYVLDLNQKRSFMRTMAKNGIRSFLLDWGDIHDVEKQMGLEDYILGRLSACVDDIIQRTGRPVCLVGYCMGGVLATAVTVLESEKVSSLILMATPWDFHAGDGSHKRVIKASRLYLEAAIKLENMLSVDAIQALFAAIDPYGILRKFEDFSRLDQASPEAEKFVAMEDWLNDGVPLSGPVAQECLFDWYIKNLPATGQWEMDGHLIDPTEITCPSLIFVPQQDRIVPTESALALGKLIPNARTKKVQAGHIGMVTGRMAAQSLYDPLSKWLLSQDF